MPRVVHLTVPSQTTAAVLADIGRLRGVLGVQVQRSSSIQPPGDVITVQLPTNELQPLMRVLDIHGIGRGPGSSFATTEPVSLVSASGAAALVREASDASWEEMELLIGKESNMSPSAMLIMALSGILAALGIATDALHVVIAAMLIAPGFEPMARISLAAAASSAGWRRGLADVAKGYSALFAGALVAALGLALLGMSPLGGNASALEPGDLAAYWSSPTVPSVLGSAAAAAAGGLLVATKRTVLTAGAMVGLALVPGAALAAIGLAGGRADVALGGALRWAIDAALVVALCFLVLAWKGARVHRRTTSL